MDGQSGAWFISFSMVCSLSVGAGGVSLSGLFGLFGRNRIPQSASVHILTMYV
jgi:hypothetical protein